MLILLATAAVVGQTDDDDFQSWHEVHIYVPLSSKVDLHVPLTLRLTRDVSRVNELRSGLGLSYKATKSLTIAPHHHWIRSRDRQGIFRTENRSVVAATYKFNTKPIGLSHRSQFELRVRHSSTSWRYRPSIKLEKSLPKSWAEETKLFVTEEPFYDSAAKRFSRNRLSFGITRAINKKTSVDVFYLWQKDTFSSPASVHVLGTSWKLRL